MTVWQPPVPLLELASLLGRAFMIMCAALLLGAACTLAAKTLEDRDG